MTEPVASPLLGLINFIETDQVKMDLSINLSDLDAAMIEHAGLELHYSICTAKSRQQYERIKNAVEILEARIDAEKRVELAEDEKKKPTEAAIKAAVLTDKRYSSAQGKMIDAQYILKLCEATENAFHSRKDMLLEVARDRRKEREGQLRVAEISATRVAMAERLSASK